MTPRQPVQDFALDMERMLQKNDHKGGWQGEELENLMDKLTEEKRELIAAIKKFNDYYYSLKPLDQNFEELKRRVIDEAADLGNVAMFIADICRHR